MRPATASELLEQARAGLERLTPQAAEQAMRRGALLVDTRCAELRTRDGVIPDSVHVPLSVLYWRLDPDSDHRDRQLAGRGRQVILLCDHGYSSSLAAATLQQMGYARATDVIGGFTAWRAAGLPVSSARRQELAEAP